MSSFFVEGFMAFFPQSALLSTESPSPSLEEILKILGSLGLLVFKVRLGYIGGTW